MFLTATFDLEVVTFGTVTVQMIQKMIFKDITFILNSTDIYQVVFDPTSALFS